MSWNQDQYSDLQRLPDGTVKLSFVIEDILVPGFRSKVHTTLEDDYELHTKSDFGFTISIDLTLSESDFVKLRMLGLEENVKATEAVAEFRRRADWLQNKSVP